MVPVLDKYHDTMINMTGSRPVSIRPDIDLQHFSIRYGTVLVLMPRTVRIEYVLIRVALKQCCGSLMFIPDPDSRIPYPIKAIKEEGEKFVVLLLFCQPQI
jgi:hypothetical protein